MSSFPSREIEVWQSSRAEALGQIDGTFVFQLTPSLMVPQSLEFLRELSRETQPNVNTVASSFIHGMSCAPINNQDSLYFWKSFADAKALFNFGFEELSDAIRQLELHLDINLTFHRITYLAILGAGPEIPLLIINRVAFKRGVSFQIEERGEIAQSLLRGDFVLSEKIKVAQQHYSTGMALLAGEDAVAGLIDAAFMQFYLTVEAILESYKSTEAGINGRKIFGTDYDDNLAKIVQHVYLARHRFFGHAHPKILQGLLDSETAFNIAKQTLVARWCARALISLELKQPLTKRDMRLYYGRSRGSVGFSGDAHQLMADFSLP